MTLETLEAFTARRSKRLNDFDKEIWDIVADALAQWGEVEWYADIVEAAGVLWSEIFEQQSPTGHPGVAIDTYLRELGESLARTAEPSDPPTESEIDRVARWVGVYTVNSATYFAGRDKGGLEKTWVTMHDEDVRSMHVAVDGVTVGIFNTFDVGGVKMHFPGEPVGSPEHWINCRCILAVSGGIEMGTKTQGFAAKAGEDVVADGDVEDDVFDGEPVLTDEEAASADFIDDDFQVPWHGVLVVEGVATGDKRMFAEAALTYRDLPLPISWQRMSADGHMQAVVIGRIDEIWLEGNEHRARGMFNANVAEANEAIDGIVFGMLGGVSVDVDDVEIELDMAESEDEDGLAALFGGEVEMTRFTKARICGAALVNIPAFQEAYIALGPDFDEETRDPSVTSEEFQDGTKHTVYDDGSESWESDDIDALLAWLNEDEAPADAIGALDATYGLLASAWLGHFAPGTHDGPGWLTHPKATQRLRSYWVKGAGAAKIRWGVPGDFNRCRMQLGKYVNPAFLAGTCANLHKEAIKVWPGQEAGKGSRGHHDGASEGFAIVASAARVEPVEAHYYTEPEGDKIMPLTLDDDHVYGYMAAWGTCHVGIGEKCIMPPASTSDYAYFATGLVDTTDGPVRTGPLMMWTGHAGMRDSLAKATRHYDDTGQAVADITIGENALGIWFSGKLRDGLTEEDIKVLRASGAVSGDWRDVYRHGVSDELIALIAVNTPGFPIPRPSFAMDGGNQIALIASAGIVVRGDREPESALGKQFNITADDLLMIGRTVADELEYRGKRSERLAEARDPELIADIETRRAEKIAAARELGD